MLWMKVKALTFREAIVEVWRWGLWRWWRRLWFITYRDLTDQELALLDRITELERRLLVEVQFGRERIAELASVREIYDHDKRRLESDLAIKSEECRKYAKVVVRDRLRVQAEMAAFGGKIALDPETDDK
jgi:hypothetical protein